jgi:hypothetical protein
MTNFWRLGLACTVFAVVLGCSTPVRPKPTVANRGPLTSDQQIDALRKADMPAAQRQFLENQVRTGQARR